MKAWPFTAFLAFFSFIYGGSALISDYPFFLGIEGVDFFYTKFGSTLSGLIFLSFGTFFLYSAVKEYKSGKEDDILFTRLLLLRVVIALIIILTLGW